jgi:hypothetical protein
MEEFQAILRTGVKLTIANLAHGSGRKAWQPG